MHVQVFPELPMELELEYKVGNNAVAMHGTSTVSSKGSTPCCTILLLRSPVVGQLGIQGTP